MKGNKIEKNIISCRLGTSYYISPEVLQGNYDYKCDIWSCGVILYLLLCGHPPFDGDTENEIYRAIMKKKYTFNENEWKNISDETKDLIKHMICEADKRYNAEMVLGHPWIEKNANNAKGNIDKLNLKNIQNYTNFSKLKKMTLFFISQNFGEKDVKELKETYEEIDADKTGTLPMEEIKNGIKKIYDKKQENKDKTEDSKSEENNFEAYFNNIDTNKNEKIDYSEFINAAMEYKAYIREEKLIDYFNMLDKYGSGKISKDEIKEVIVHEGLEDEIAQKIINEFNLDGEGEIDFMEFVVGLNNLNKKEEEPPEIARTQTIKKDHK